jgi:hypothetical protein
MTHDKLPLFEWSAKTKVIPFPCSRRVGKIRRVAEVLSRKSDCPKDASIYWKRMLNDLERQMARAGIGPDQIEAELQEFSAACRCAMRWSATAGRFPDDAS